MDYNLFASSYRPQDGSSSTNLNAYGTAGINAGAWRLRSDYQLNKTDSEDNHDQSGGISRTYLFRPLPQLGSVNPRRNRFQFQYFRWFFLYRRGTGE